MKKSIEIERAERNVSVIVKGCDIRCQLPEREMNEHSTDSHWEMQALEEIKHNGCCKSSNCVAQIGLLVSFL